MEAFSVKLLIDIQCIPRRKDNPCTHNYFISFLKKISTVQTLHSIYLLSNRSVHENNITNDLEKFFPKESFVVFNTLKSTFSDKIALQEYKKNVSELVREKFIEDLNPDLLLVLLSPLHNKSKNSIFSIGKFSNMLPVAILFDGTLPIDSKGTYKQFSKYLSNNKQYFEMSNYIFTSSKLKQIVSKSLPITCKNKIIDITFNGNKFTDDTILQIIKQLKISHLSFKRINLEKPCIKSTSLLLELISRINNNLSLQENLLLDIASAIAKNEEYITDHHTQAKSPVMQRWRIEGPCESSFSLALVNMETARALQKLGHDVALVPVDKRETYTPDIEYLRQHSDLWEMYKRSKNLTQDSADIVSRNMYPPVVEDMHGNLNLIHGYGWEETGFPYEWMDHFNKTLDGITVMSKHIEKTFIDNGINIPICTTGIGSDHWEHVKTNDNYLVEGKSFRFLHVSVCSPRKGADVMIKAFADKFSNSDDVSLIIKTIPNAKKQLEEWIAEIREKKVNIPDIRIIYDDLPKENLKKLYNECHALIGPSRAEGFGLPFAEAMLLGLPVVTTNWGGQIDFCTHETAWLIDYEFQLSQTSFNLFDSVWAEPSQEHLGETMLQLSTMPEDDRKKRSISGREKLLKQFKWIDAAKRLADFADTLPITTKSKKQKVCWITPWKNKCSITDHSKHMIDNGNDNICILASNTLNLTEKNQYNISPCWDEGVNDKLISLYETVQIHNPDSIIIQFRFAFFDINNFARFIDKQIDLDRKVIILMHETTTDTISNNFNMPIPTLKRVDRILVFSYHDLNVLKKFGLVHNVALFPYGVLTERNADKTTTSVFTLISFGFALPYKGLIALIDTIHLLLNKGIPIRLKMINAEDDTLESKICVKKINLHISNKNLEQNIEFISEYLPHESLIAHFEKADLAIFPYQSTKDKSYSSAAMYALGLGKPIAVTHLSIFDHIRDLAYELSGTNAVDISKDILNIMYTIKNNEAAHQRKNKQIVKWKKYHSHILVSSKLQNMISML